MNLPKMILFNNGGTLTCEPDWDPKRGNAELMKYVTKNPNNCTLEDIRKEAEYVFNHHVKSIRKNGYDVSGQLCLNVLYEYLGMEFSLTPLEMETVFWDGASSGAIMPNTNELLDYLDKKGIRTAVISNLFWSSAALKIRLDRLLKNNHFEYILSSSDYLFRKSNNMIFDILLQKSGLRADEVWYCGNNPKVDVLGAAKAGIFPVWYDYSSSPKNEDSSNQAKPCCEHLHIKDWSELINIIEQL